MTASQPSPAVVDTAIRPLDPLFGMAFAHIFGSDHSKHMTKHFVDCILAAAGLDSMGEVQKMTTEYTFVDGSVTCLSAGLDVRLMSQCHIVDIDAQRRVPPVEDRASFYASQLIDRDLDPDTIIVRFPRVVVITLFDGFSKFPDEEGFVAVHRPEWRLGNSTRPGSDCMRFVLVELEKIRTRCTCLNEDILDNELLSWLYLLTKGYRRQEEMLVLAKAHPYIAEFVRLYDIVAGDSKIVQAYEDDCQSMQYAFSLLQD